MKNSISVSSPGKVQSLWRQGMINYSLGNKLGREWAVQEFSTCVLGRCLVKEKGRLQTKAQKGHLENHSIFIMTGRTTARAHTPGLHVLPAQRFKTCGDTEICNRSKPRELAAGPRHCDLGTDALPASQHKCDVNVSPNQAPWIFFSGWVID